MNLPVKKYILICVSIFFDEVFFMLIVFGSFKIWLVFPFLPEVILESFFINLCLMSCDQQSEGVMTWNKGRGLLEVRPWIFLEGVVSWGSVSCCSMLTTFCAILFCFTQKPLPVWMGFPPGSEYLLPVSDTWHNIPPVYLTIATYL